MKLGEFYTNINDEYKGEYKYMQAIDDKSGMFFDYMGCFCLFYYKDVRLVL
jgi:hypothetical protein